MDGIDGRVTQLACIPFQDLSISLSLSLWISIRRRMASIRLVFLPGDICFSKVKQSLIRIYLEGRYESHSVRTFAIWLRYLQFSMAHIAADGKLKQNTIPGRSLSFSRSFSSFILEPSNPFEPMKGETIFNTYIPLGVGNLARDSGLDSSPCSILSI